jgi:peptidoglycan hydrolase-like protein with peptidoglycan-binding domain
VRLIGLSLAERTPLERRRRVTVATSVGLMVVIGLIGFAFGSVMRSPAERKLTTTPPELGWLSVPVKLDRLGSDVVVQAQVMTSTAATVELPRLSSEGMVITRLPALGARFDDGQSVLELEGRPVLLLPGTEPLYRDLVGGISGRDVEAVQRALVALDLDPGVTNGHYGPETARAVESLYRQAGYTQPASPIETTAIEAAETAIADGRENLRQASAAVAAARADRTEQVEVAKTTVATATAELDRARSSATEQLAKATEETEAAQTTHDRALAATQENSSPKLQQELTDAASRLQDAEAAQLAVEADGHRSVEQAQTVLLDAAKALDKAAAGSASVGPSEYPVTSATAALQQLIRRLDELKLAAITPLPLAEIALVPTLPAAVIEVTGSIGKPVAKRAVVLGDPTSSVILSAVSRDIAGRLATDQPVTIDTDGAEVADGAVSWLAPTVGPEAANERYGSKVEMGPGLVAVEVQPNSPFDLPIGSAVSLHFELFITQEPGLVVPQGAIRTNADGHTWVAVATPAGNFQRVDVSLGQSADGAVMVTSAGLSQGDKVILGKL